MPTSPPATAGRVPRSWPFAGLRLTIAVAVLYLAGALLWVLQGGRLPGGRWLAVHLFTLGALTNLVVALTAHFAQTLLHTPDRGRAAGTRTVRLVTVNVGVLAVIVGLPSGQRPLVAAGATVLTAGVLWLYIDLRRMRKVSLTGRFAFVVRGYERACGAFLHAALLGALMGTAVLTGDWYAAARSAHLHAGVLGWGGLALLATLVFFGPTVMRARMEPGADASAATGLRIAATGLSVAVLALLLTGLGDGWELPARLLAGGGLAAYAFGVGAVCLPVLRTGRRAQASSHARMLQASCGWFLAVAAADVLVVATDSSRLLTALGVAILVGVLAQAVLASLGYLTPMAFSAPGQGVGSRSAALRRQGALPVLRPLVFNAGVGLVVAAAMVGPGGGGAWAFVARLGWMALGAAAAVHLVLVLMTMASTAATTSRPPPAA